MSTFVQLDYLSVALILYVIALALVDTCKHRIPNVLSAAAAILGFALQGWLHSKAGMLSALGGLAVGFGMFLPFYLLRAFGAGDVKAMAVVGIFLGAQTTLLAGALTLIAGAALGVIVLWMSPAPAAAALYRVLGLILAPVAALRRRGQASVPQPSLRFPYGAAIASGTLAALLLSQWTGF